MIQQVGWEVRGTFKGAKDVIISICFGMLCAWFLREGSVLCGEKGGQHRE